MRIGIGAEIKAIADAARQAVENPRPPPPVTPEDLGPLLMHPATTTLAKQLGAKMHHVYDHLFLEEAPYDTICIKPSDHEATYYTRHQMHHLLWTYIIHRTSAVMTLETEGYIIGGQALVKQPLIRFISASDEAFVAFFTSLIMDLDTVESITRYSKGHGRLAIIDDEKSIRAFKVWTEEPLRWTVQQKVGQILEYEEIVRVWFESSTGAGDAESVMVWEGMSKTYAGCVCRDERYEF